MSFLAEIQKKKKNLHHCETVVTTTGGVVFKEEKVGQIFHRTQTLTISPGYIVDTKPDLQIVDVMQGLYMGSQDVAGDENILKQNKITHIVSLGVNVVQFSDICYQYVDILDLPETDIISVANQCFSYISDARGCGGSVLIHCNAGVSRSAAVIIAYLMKYNNLSFDQAYKYLKAKRESVRPNDGFIKQLQLYEKVVEWFLKMTLNNSLNSDFINISILKKYYPSVVNWI